MFSKYIITVLGMGIVIISTQGCVSQKDYAELFQKNEQLTSEVDALRKESKLLKDNNALSKELDQLKEENKRLREKKEASEKQVKSLTEPKTEPFGVVIIAPSVSTSIEARNILYRQGWRETNLRNAKAALVVVRSMLFNPLSFSYESYGELKEDAKRQLNISGQNFHVYTYSLDDELKPVQLKHISYEADRY